MPKHKVMHQIVVHFSVSYCIIMDLCGVTFGIDSVVLSKVEGFESGDRWRNAAHTLWLSIMVIL